VRLDGSMKMVEVLYTSANAYPRWRQTDTSWLISFVLITLIFVFAAFANLLSKDEGMAVVDVRDMRSDW
jgi:hypothetical protein